MVGNEAQREQFEAWVTSLQTHPQQPPYFGRKENGEYEQASMEFAWLAYQSATEQMTPLAEALRRIRGIEFGEPSLIKDICDQALATIDGEK